LSDTIQHLEELIGHGRFFEARARAEEVMKTEDTLRVRQLYALAVSKSGSPQVALDFLLPAYAANPDDSETAGILGGIYKELFKKHQDSKYAILSRDTYAKNFSITNNYYTGINAATMSAIAGKAMQGREIANKVITLLGGEVQGLWELATLGEAYLLAKNRERSVECYIKARKVAGNDWGKVLSVHNQLWLLNHYVPVPKEVLRIFAPPEVVAFAGHMVDARGRNTPRFPAMIESNVKESIRAAIRTLHASIGYCSLACGGDILFAEAMIEEGGEVHILMPFNKEDFIQTSLRFAGDEWVNRFEHLIARYPVTSITRERYGGNDDLFSLLGKIIFGSAVLRSQMYHQEPHLLTVLSEFDLKQKEGGTRDTVQMWPFPQRHSNISPDSFYKPEEVPSSLPLPKSERERIENRPVLYIVCIDLSGLHTMERERIQKIIDQFREGQQQLALTVLKDTDEHLVFALDTEIALMDLVRTVWNSTSPFRPEKPLRIGLHAGPVHLKITQDYNNNYVEAITRFAPMGAICLSANMAAVLALHPKKFQLDYVGVVRLPDEADNIGLYQLQFKA
jgi:tetratricopeptide (TPR) repeat protein